MDGSKFTTRSVEVINAAHTLAVTAGNPQVEPAHLAAALLRQDQGIAPAILSKAGVDPAGLAGRIDSELAQLPSASGSTVQNPATSPGLTRVLAKALELAEEMKDDFIATEHLLLALATVEGPVQVAFHQSGADVGPLRAAITAVRGNRHVTSQDAEATYE